MSTSAQRFNFTFYGNPPEKLPDFILRKGMLQPNSYEVSMPRPDELAIGRSKTEQDKFFVVCVFAQDPVAFGPMTADELRFTTEMLAIPMGWSAADAARFRETVAQLMADIAAGKPVGCKIGASDKKLAELHDALDAAAVASTKRLGEAIERQGQGADGMFKRMAMQMALGLLLDILSGPHMPKHVDQIRELLPKLPTEVLIELLLGTVFARYNLMMTLNTPGWKPLAVK